MAYIRKLPSGMWQATVRTPEGRQTATHFLKRAVAHWAAELERPARQRRTPLERLLPKIDQRGPSDCWPWKGYVYPKTGYGTFRMPEGTRPAHRAAYTLLIGPIPEGMEIDHRCRRRDCVNPAHLEPVTAVVNVNRGRGARRFYCLKGHAMTPDNIGNRASGRRYCMICHRERERRRRAAFAAHAMP